MWFLMVSVAGASPVSVPEFTPAPTVAATGTPHLPDGINLVQAGVLLTSPEGAKSVVPVKSWLLPDSYYREAIMKARQLELFQPALDVCTAKAIELQNKVVLSLNSCEEQFDADQTLIFKLSDQVGTLETRALVAEDKVKDIRSQRNIAWAITGGLVIGAVAVTAVAIAP